MPHEQPAPQGRHARPDPTPEPAVDPAADDAPQQPTVTEVAAAAGVSAATVSRVLTGRVRVSTSARVQVHEAIAQLGYVRHRAPRQTPARPQAHTIAAVVCEPSARLFHDPFYPRLLGGAEEALNKRGLPLMIMSATRNTVPVATSFLTTGGVSGVLLVSAHDHNPIAISLAASRVVVRSAGRPPDGITVPFADVDNRDGARQAVEHLLLRGRRQIAMIAGPADLPASADRRLGFRLALEAAGIAGPVAYGDFTSASGAHAMGWLLNRAPRLDGVFVASDTMAAGALQTLRRAGRRVPDDVAVVGFDDAPLAAYTTPALTTVRQPVEDLGSVAADLILAGLAGHDVRDDNPVLPTELVVRASS
jgi:DNA-binding LacI/PurR family transcriptional regulator